MRVSLGNLPIERHEVPVLGVLKRSLLHGLGRVSGTHGALPLSGAGGVGRGLFIQRGGVLDDARARGGSVRAPAPGATSGHLAHAPIDARAAGPRPAGECVAGHQFLWPARQRVFRGSRRESRGRHRRVLAVVGTC
jgi:hypothetical protein